MSGQCLVLKEKQRSKLTYEPKQPDRLKTSVHPLALLAFLAFLEDFRSTVKG